jgi:hypothetical protein
MALREATLNPYKSMKMTPNQSTVINTLSIDVKPSLDQQGEGAAHPIQHENAILSLIIIRIHPLVFKDIIYNICKSFCLLFLISLTFLVAYLRFIT